jgi:hypothetical protein
MKKIKNAKQLEAEKEHLDQRRRELEKAIKYDWRDLTESLKPANISMQVLSKVFEKNETRIKSSYGFKRFVGSISGNIKKWLEKSRMK